MHELKQTPWTIESSSQHTAGKLVDTWRER